MRSIPAPSWLADDIEREIQVHPAGLMGRLSFQSLAAVSGLPLAIKYVPTQWAKSYVGLTAKLKISTTPGFTWGTGTYVTHSAFPISGAIFGRIGVVAQFDPTAWRVFDATEPRAQALYLSWIQIQPLYRVLALTLHSQLANQYLRNLFRTVFRIDCVLFRPDQFNLNYTQGDDIWMNVTDWTPEGEILTTFSERLLYPRMVVIAEEEFQPDEYDIGRMTLIGPLTAKPSNATVQTQIAAAYRAGTLLRLLA